MLLSRVRISQKLLARTFRVMTLATHVRVADAKTQENPVSPSNWTTRSAIVVLALVGASIASFLAAYQFGLVRDVWEPFFGSGSQRVLHSFVSRLLPLPDAAVGALGYFAEIVATLLGTSERYRNHPRLVLCYGAIVVGAAVTAIALTFTQLVIIHAACTLCLCSAAISLVIAYLASDEIVAAVCVLYEKRKT